MDKKMYFTCPQPLSNPIDIKTFQNIVDTLPICFNIVWKQQNEKAWKIVTGSSNKCIFRMTLKNCTISPMDFRTSGIIDFDSIPSPYTLSYIDPILSLYYAGSKHYDIRYDRYAKNIDKLLMDLKHLRSRVSFFLLIYFF